MKLALIIPCFFSATILCSCSNKTGNDNGTVTNMTAAQPHERNILSSVADEFFANPGFANINADQELPEGGVGQIFQDHIGFMWFASGSGLNRYDGVKVVTFTHNPKDSTTLSSNLVSCLYDDGKNLWVGTINGGLDKYDFATGRFQAYKHINNDNTSLAANSVAAIGHDNNNTIWIGAGSVLERFEPTTGRFSHFPIPAKVTGRATINDICCDAYGTIWIVTVSGCYRFDTAAGTFAAVEEIAGYPAFLKQHQPLSVAQDADSNIWIGGSGAACYIRAQNRFISFKHERGNNNSLADGFIGSLTDDHAGHVWLGSSNGISIYNRKTGSFTHVLHIPGDNRSLRNNTIYSLYRDRDGIIWCGTSDGVSRVDPYSNKFKVLQCNPLDKHSLSSNTVRNIIQSREDGDIWIATENGVNRIDSATRKSRLYVGPGVSGNLIQYITWALHQDSKGNIWIGTWGGGLYQLDPHANKYRAYLAGDSKVEGSYIISIAEDSLHRFWLATWGEGVFLFDPGTGKYVNYRADRSKNNTVRSDHVMQVFIDHAGVVWAATGSGLDRYRSLSDDFEHFDSDTANKDRIRGISNVIEARDSSLWVTTPLGLYQVGPARNSIRHFTVADGLPSATVASVIEDGDRNLWVGTLNGLAKMSRAASCKKPAAGRNTNIKNCDLFTRYTTNDGLPSNIFSNGSCLDRSGNIYMGTADGVVIFDPKKMINNSGPPQLQITSVKKQNREQLQGHRVMDLQQVTLNYHEHTLAFEFAALSYNQPSKNEYAYKLDGWDEDWQYVGNRNFASYTNLSPGKYTFRVKAANNDGIWNETGIMIRVRVLPPWWKTWWFYTLSILTIGLCVVAYNRSRFDRLRKQKEMLEATVGLRTHELLLAKERAEQSEKFKQQFLANMSHEIRTPMNAVVGMTNLLIAKEPKQDQRFYLNGIKKSSETLLHIINDILDLSKIEAGKIELEHIPFLLADVIGQVQYVMQGKADEKGLALVNHTDPDAPQVLIGDPVRLNQVLMNLTANALKFTERGSVVIEVKLLGTEKDTARLRFAVTDTGIGISKEKVESIFESFTQANISDTRKYGGTGLGLSISRELVELQGGTLSVESEEGYGSCFSFDIRYNVGSIQDLEKLEHSEQAEAAVLNGLRIIIADDSDYNRIVAGDTLRVYADVHIAEAQNGKEVIDLLRAETYDLILMDIQMPEMGGYEATEFIRKNLPAPACDIRIIALTASILRSDLYKCTAAGMNDYVLKPFKPQDLINAVARITNRARTVTAKSKSKKGETIAGTLTNLDFLTQFCKGDATQAAKYIDLFVAAAGDHISSIQKALDEKDYPAIRKQAHALRPKLNMMGMKQTVDIAASIEQLVTEGKYSNKIEQLTSNLILNISLAKTELLQPANNV